jgi:rfaE bifunctional protein nucleotidyltransferase chain/domain
MANIFTFDQLPVLLKKLNYKKLVVVGGCFDLLHLGHIIFLQQAKQKGEILLVLLESDETIQKLKGKHRPIHSQFVRAQILAELKSVDYVLQLPPLSTDQEYDELITTLHPSIIATTEGDEYDFHKKRQAKKVGAKILYVTPVVKDHSTTKIIEQIKSKK